MILDFRWGFYLFEREELKISIIVIVFEIGVITWQYCKYDENSARVLYEPRVQTSLGVVISHT